MRHDQTAKAMILGLYEMSWDYGRHIRGLQLLTASAAYPDLDFKSRNLINVTTGRLARIHKGSRRVMPILKRTIKRKKWKTSYPTGDEMAEPVSSLWVGLSGDGACKDCLKKPPVEPEFGTEYDEFVPEMLGEIWRALVLLESYRRHQISHIYETGFFKGNEDGRMVEAAYQMCGGVIQVGLECMCVPIEGYSSVWLHRNLDTEEIEERLSGDFGLEVTDCTLARDWCATCRGNLVAFDTDPFSL